MISALEDTSVRLWDLTTDEVNILGEQGANVIELAFSPDGKLLASAGFNGPKLWDLEQGRERNGLRLPEGLLMAFAVAFSPDGRQLALGGLLNVSSWAQVFDLASGMPIRSLDGHSFIVASIGFSRDGSRIATAALDGTARVWNSAGLPEALRLEGHDAPVSAIALNGDGGRMASGSWDQSVRIWDIVSGECLHTLATGFPIRSLALNRAGNRLVTPSRDATATVWNLADGKPLLRISGHTKRSWPWR
jgi:WD40 repeat protein